MNIYIKGSFVWMITRILFIMIMHREFEFWQPKQIFRASTIGDNMGTTTTEKGKHSNIGKLD